LIFMYKKEKSIKPSLKNSRFAQLVVITGWDVF
jgi:hypothetical protein